MRHSGRKFDAAGLIANSVGIGDVRLQPFLSVHADIERLFVELECGIDLI
jgi:hypothetical protein